MTDPHTALTLDEALHLLRRAHHHEIRGALNALRLQLTLLQRGREKTTPDDPRFGQWVDGAATEAEAVERALDELSAVERVDEVVQSDDPVLIAERVAGLLEPLAKSRQVRLQVEPASVDAADTEAGTVPAPGRLAASLLAQGAAGLATAEPGSALRFRVGSEGIEIFAGSLHLSYEHFAEPAPQ